MSFWVYVYLYGRHFLVWKTLQVFSSITIGRQLLEIYKIVWHLQASFKKSVFFNTMVQSLSILPFWKPQNVKKNWKPQNVRIIMETQECWSHSQNYLQACLSAGQIFYNCSNYLLESKIAGQSIETFSFYSHLKIWVLHSYSVRWTLKWPLSHKMAVIALYQRPLLGINIAYNQYMLSNSQDWYPTWHSFVDI